MSHAFFPTLAGNRFDCTLAKLRYNRCLELTIEKLIYGGDGLARIAPVEGRSKAVFVPFVLEGERVELRLTESKPGFARGQLERVVEPSPERIEARCPYFLRCGGCQYQHTSYENQLRIKAQIQRETLQRIAKIDPPHAVVHPSAPWHYRNRTRMKVRSVPDFAIGYYRFASHDLLAVEECPISSPLINRALKALWQIGRASGLAGVTEVEYFVNDSDSALLLEFYSPKPDLRAMREAAEELAKIVPELQAAVAFRAAREKEFTSDRGQVVFGQSSLGYAAAGHNYRVSGGSFFQTNRFLADELVRTVCADRNGGEALDLYAGVGLFSLPLASMFERVSAVEIAPASVDDLLANATHRVKAVRATAEQFLQRAGRKVRADFVVVDPPRGGLVASVAKRLAALSAPKITYVSCDPATLARDLHVLLAAGYGIERLHLIDLFPQTFHIESVVELTAS